MNHVLTDSDTGRRIEVSVGDGLEIVLTGNPNAGYQWLPVKVDPEVLAPAAEAGYAPISDSLGAGGSFRLRFAAVRPGRTALALEYRRPFERDGPPLRAFKIVVSVTAASSDQPSVANSTERAR